MKCPDELIKRYRERRLIPFVGAGVSMSVKWKEGAEERRGPSWRELVDYIASDLGFQPPDLIRARGTDLQILEYYKIKKHNNFAPFQNWLVTRLNPPKAAVRRSPIHKALAQMKNCETFYTTNFDNFLERSFELNGRPCKAVVVESEMPRDPQKCNIVKFHGDLDHPQEMVISETQYEERLRLAHVLDYRFRADVLANALLFIGYSFRDPNVSYLFTLMANDLGSLPNSVSGMRAYITAADPSDFECELFRKRNMEVIPIRSTAMSEDITALLNKIKS
jgi:hypothetical protein